tara:strand:- start:43632 stop:43955 length:324 start_codon:yes stop_codon:yes gene_type:complete
MPLAKRILDSDQPKHHLGLLKMYINMEQEYKDACVQNIDDNEKFRFFAHRFKSALCYVADEDIVAKISALEKGFEQDSKWKTEKLAELFTLLDDLTENVKAYREEHA